MKQTICKSTLNIQIKAMVLSSNSSRGEFIISNARRSDAGMYICTAENRAVPVGVKEITRVSVNCKLICFPNLYDKPNI